MSIDATTLWIVIAGMAVGSYAMRFAFLGLVGGRELPDWALRLLRYTAVSMLPALVAPLVIWPSGTGGEPDPARMAAAFATLAVGYVTKNVLAGMASGAATLYALLWLV